MTRLVSIVLAHSTNFVLSLGCSVVLSQEIDCGGSDYRCLQLQYEVACRESVATKASCDAFLQRLEGNEHSDEVDWLLIRAATLAVLMEQEVGRVDQEAYRNQAIAVLQKALELDSSNTEALMGLSVLSEGRERRRFLEEALASDPGNRFALEGLVSILADSGTRADLEQAASLMATAYSTLEAGTLKWHIASSLYNILGRINTEDAVRFADTVGRDAGLYRLPLALDDMNLEEIPTLLQTVCNDDVAHILPDDSCSKAIDLSFEKFVEEQVELRNQERVIFAEAITHALIEVTRGYVPDTGDAPPFDKYLMYANYLADLGLPSSLVYQLQASLERGDEQLAMMKRAVELDDSNGRLYYRLALMHFERANWSEAIENFAIARPLLPDWRYPVLDQFVSDAEAALSER